ncbi:SPFH domain-containing protein [Candidatus Nitrosocosmicus franklandus]|uniref:Membrane protease subunit, stomatin/prohibitin (Modular protein) n=1 Tax=Candidatus Nitrosocosmicus franklandianus TaxID=1798806 RepID=A0A484I8A3_9ARCH|nr:SPFH domain-containing protein [Candidatus Nitrosocosmicus franklandus]VFJ13431.1 Membrane protease subunit, stomatin/prohibitin (Modular protein) [Candidatus Nitrosocosmicus franklandus]
MSTSKSIDNFLSSKTSTRKGTGFQIVIGVIILIFSIILYSKTFFGIIFYILLLISIVLITSSFFIIINQYERAIILRLGVYKGQVRPGIHTRLPLIDNVLVIDIREKVREFNAEKMLTKDNVPVTIDAILRYKIIEERSNDALLNVENFNEMIKQVSQTTLRNNIGSSNFQEILSRREEINQNIKSIISREAENWGVMVTGVEIRQVIIPQELEAAMSMQAQAEREKQARVTYGDSEILVAQKFLDASRIYSNNPVAYALRQSNMLYETMKIHGNTIIMIPSEALNSMGFGNLGTTIAYLKNLESGIRDDKKRKV